MSILMERMLTHWLTHITSSLCSRPVSYCMQSLDSASLLVSIQHGLQTDLIAQSHLTHLQVSPDSTPTIPAMASPDPLSLSQDVEFLHYQGLLYVPNNQDV